MQDYCVYFSYFIFFSVSSSIVGCTVFVSHFARFSVIFAIFQALPCEFLIFLLCQVLLDIFQVLQCLCSIFHFFQWFLPYSRSYHISFSFSSFDIFLAIFQVLKWVCIPFHVFQFFQHILVPVMWISLFFFFIFQFYRHIPGPTVCISYFPPFSVFLAIFQVLQCVSHFTHFTVFLHMPGPTMFISHFSSFSVFLALFHV